MKKMLIAFVLCVLMLGCVTTSTLRLDPQALDGQKKISREGVDAVVSEKKVLVTVRPSTDTFSTQDRPTLVVSVYCTEKPFNFSPENIEVFVDGSPHRVFTYGELAADIKEREKSEKKKADTVKEAQYASGGGGGMGTASANKQYQANLQKAEKKAYNALKDLKANGLKAVRVLANKQYSGHVTIENIPNPSLSHKIKVIVTALGEKHEFLLNQVEVQ